MRLPRSFGSEEIALGIFFILAGLFAIFCAVKDYDWFMENRKAWIFVKLLGRNGARVFYVLLGLFLIGISLAMLFQQHP